MVRTRSQSDEAIKHAAEGISGLRVSAAGMKDTADSSDFIQRPDVTSNSVDPRSRATGSTPPPQPIGALSVDAVIQSPNCTTVEAASVPEASTFSGSQDAMKLMSRPHVKKSSVAKKGAAKKLSMDTAGQSPSSASGGINSFEAVERDAARAQQEEEDRRMAQQLAKEFGQQAAAEGASSGRVAAMMQEAEDAPKSLYRTSPTPIGTGSSKSPYSVFRSPAGGGGAKAFAVTAAEESYEARSKYANVKGISSDQFFGQSDAETSAMRDKLLDRYSGSTAISSDMLYSEQNGGSYGGSTYGGGGGDLDKLKDSVSGFFDDIHRRMG